MSKNKIVLPETFFDASKSAYWIKIGPSRFLELSERDAKRRFMRAGVAMEIDGKNGLTLGDEKIMELQDNFYVDWAGPLAGHKAGLFYGDGDTRVLVTTQVTAIQPGKGTHCPKIEKYFEELFGPDQTRFVLFWLKCAWESLERGDFRPGQMLALAGKASCGKSFFHWLVTQLLGGRAEKPYRYMTGQTHFNAELMGAEHLYIEDENPKINPGARREFGTAIKNWTVNNLISLHAKGRTGITLPSFHRLTLSVNDEPEFLMILPPMDESVQDKIALLKCSKAELSSDRLKNQRDFKAELPALVASFLRLKIPRDWRDDRFGVKTYHHPDLLAALAETSEEQQMQLFIDEVIFSKATVQEFEGTAMELEREIRNSPFAAAAQQFFRFTSACGTYLARLQKKQPERFTTTKSRGRTIWLIKKEK